MSPLLETFGFASVRGYQGVSAAGGAYELIATAAGSGSSSTVTFASIPAGYKHLQLRLVLGSTAAFNQNSSAAIRLNGNTTANKTFHQMAGNGSAVNASSGLNDSDVRFEYRMINGNAAGVAIVDILDPFSTTNNKTVRMFSGYEFNGSLISLRSALWPNTAAVTSVAVVEVNGYLWSTRSRFSLYGIKG